MPIVWGVGLPIVIYCRITSPVQKKIRAITKRMEDEFPDALYRMGTLIIEGKSIEQVLTKVSASMEGAS